MALEGVIAVLEREGPAGAIEPAASIDAQPSMYVDAASIAEVLRLLRDHPELRFTLLAELTASDFWPRQPRFEVVYLLVSPELRHRLRVKVRLPADDPHLPSVTGIWPAANWLEREVWDLFGIAFDGHPDPRRLLMPEDWEGFPLRKDYPVQINQRVQTTEPTQVSAEEFRANVERDRLDRTTRVPR